MAIGFATWDANGNPNNTGFTRIMSVGLIGLGEGSTGTWSFYVPPGYSLAYFAQCTATGGGSSRRRIGISGGNITVSIAGEGDFSADTIPGYPVNLLVYVRF